MKWFMSRNAGVLGDALALHVRHYSGWAILLLVVHIREPWKLFGLQTIAQDWNH